MDIQLDRRLRCLLYHDPESLDQEGYCQQLEELEEFEELEFEEEDPRFDSQQHAGKPLQFVLAEG